MGVTHATLDWYGCATFRLTLPGDLVIFLDAYIDRVPDAAGPQPPCFARDIDRADWIIVGHSHFDHLWGAEQIAARTGATIIASYESVRVMADAGVPASQLLPVSGGERVRLRDDVHVTVFPSLHSCVWSHQQMHGPGDVCLGDLGVVHQERLGRLAELFQFFQTLSPATQAHLRDSDQRARGDGGALVYLFETPEGTLLYQDTSGHWSGVLQNLRPDVAILAAAGRGNLDGEPIQGSLAQFVARQAMLVRPRRIILGHHDDWLPGFSVATDITPIVEEVARWVPGCTVEELSYVGGERVFV